VARHGRCAATPSRGLFLRRIWRARISPRSIPVDLEFWPAIHIKSASDLGIPLVGVGLFYGQGYFRQRLDRDGWQHEEYLETDVSQLAMEAAHREKMGRPVCGAGRYPARRHFTQKSGRVKVGRCDFVSLLDFRRGRQHSRGPRDDLAFVRRRRPRPRASGTASRRWRPAGSEKRSAITPRSSSPERRTQADLQSSKRFANAWKRRASVSTWRCRAFAREVVFTNPPLRYPPGHDRFDADLIEEHSRTSARGPRGFPRENFMALGRENSRQ